MTTPALSTLTEVELAVVAKDAKFWDMVATALDGRHGDPLRSQYGWPQALDFARLLPRMLATITALSKERDEARVELKLAMQNMLALAREHEKDLIKLITAEAELIAVTRRVRETEASTKASMDDLLQQLAVAREWGEQQRREREGC